MGKKALVPLFVLLAAGIFFYSVLAPADAPAGPVAAGAGIAIALAGKSVLEFRGSVTRSVTLIVSIL